METWHQIFSWSSVILAILAGIASGGAYYTANKIQDQKDAQIESLKPRTITDVQKSELLEKISQHKSKIGFVSRLMDGESSDFANRLADVFKEAGWEVVPAIRTSLNDFPGYLSIVVTGENLDASADFICRSFREINIDCRKENIQESSIGGLSQINTVYVVVGRKK